jgi:hypothetical protein
MKMRPNSANMKKRPNSGAAARPSPRVAPRLELEAEALEPRVLFSGSPAPAEAPTEPEAEAPAETVDEAPTAASAPAAEGSVDVVADEGSPVTQDAEAAPLWAVSNGDSDISEAQTVGIVGTDPQTQALNQEILEKLANAAAERWRATGLSVEQSNALDSLSYSITNFGTDRLGVVQGLSITIDDDAAGNSWFIDLTPLQDEEYSALSNGSLSAVTGSGAAGRFDLLTVLFHEQGHALGLLDQSTEPSALMNEFLGQSERRLPVAGLAVGTTPGSVTEPEYLTARNDVGYSTNEDTVLNVAASEILRNDRDGRVLTLNNATAVRLSDGLAAKTYTSATVIGNTLTDGFLYDPFNPTAPMPATIYSTSNTFHGWETAGQTIVVTYNIAGGVTLATGEELVFDLYGRSGFTTGLTYDNDFDVVFLSGGSVVGTAVTGLGIPDVGPQHLRVSSTQASLGSGASIDQIRITARHNKFTLQEVRAAILEPLPSVISHDAYSANGAVVVVNPDGSFSFDPKNAVVLQALNKGESVDDTFTYVVAGTASLADRTPRLPSRWMECRRSLMLPFPRMRIQP